MVVIFGANGGDKSGLSDLFLSVGIKSDLSDFSLSGLRISRGRPGPLGASFTSSSRPGHAAS